MTYLGSRQKSGLLDPENRLVPGAWTIKFGPEDLYPGDFEVFHMALVGPGGPFRVFIDDAFYSADDRGDLNEYDPQHPMYVRRGQSIYFYWMLATGAAPSVWIYSQTPAGVI